MFEEDCVFQLDTDSHLRAVDKAVATSVFRVYRSYLSMSPKE